MAEKFTSKQNKKPVEKVTMSNSRFPGTRLRYYSVSHAFGKQGNLYINTELLKGSLDNAEPSCYIVLLCLCQYYFVNILWARNGV